MFIIHVSLTKQTLQDKLRLVLLSYMLDTTGSKAIEQSMHELVKQLGGDQHAFAYVKRWK